MKKHYLKSKNFLQSCRGNSTVCENCLHLISGEIQDFAEKFTITEQPSLPGFDINTISKAHNLPIERYEQECKVSEFRSVRN